MVVLKATTTVFVFELVRRDGTFGLVADVDEDDLRFDFKDATSDDRSFVEFAEGSCDHLRESSCAHLCLWVGSAGRVNRA